MGLFDFLKKKKSAVTVSISMYNPSQQEMEQQFKAQSITRMQNFQKDAAGLYPHEILMLSYAEKYSAGEELATFWSREYNVDDVASLLKSLESRGFLCDGKLTAAGQAEVDKNEYVLYIHRHKNFNISMADLCILVNKHPDIRYKDLIWGEFNRMLMEYSQSGRLGWYRNVKHSMYCFLWSEKQYEAAFLFIAEVFLLDLNMDKTPFIAPGIGKEFRKIERKIDYTQDEIIQALESHFLKVSTPYQNVPKSAAAQIILAYCFGNDEVAESNLQRFFPSSSQACR